MLDSGEKVPIPAGASFRKSPNREHHKELPNKKTSQLNKFLSNKHTKNQKSLKKHDLASSGYNTVHNMVKV